MSKEFQQKDRLFTDIQFPRDFVFDEKVASIFDDMINRSVPGYSTIITMIGVLAEHYYKENTHIYDLGCSLGGASFSILENFRDRSCSIIAIDNSAPMIERLEHKKRQYGKIADQIESRCENIKDSSILRASVVVLNFTLQFLAPDDRGCLIEKIYQGMRPGGILIISEKIVFSDDHLNNLLINSHHQFKENMGYSALEISRKRAALENVMIPETLAAHKQRIMRSGFSAFEVWFQCLNFASIIAIK